MDPDLEVDDFQNLISSFLVKFSWRSVSSSLPRCIVWNAVLAIVKPSVCPSVCQTHELWQMKVPSEKSSIIANRKSTRSFPMSLRWTAYIAPKASGGGQSDCFPYKKLGFSRRKSATKFLCVKRFSGKVVRHSLAYLTVHKWLVANIPLNVIFFAWSEPPIAMAVVPISAFRKLTHTLYALHWLQWSMKFITMPIS